MHAPALGSAMTRELPDVLAGDGEVFYAIEAKAPSDRPIYLNGGEVGALVYFPRNFGARAHIAVRFDREDWYSFRPSSLYVTGGGNYRIKKEVTLVEGEDFESFAGGPTQTKLGGD